MPDAVRIIDDFLPEEVLAAQMRHAAAAPYGKTRYGALDYGGISRDEALDAVPVFALHGLHIIPKRQFFRIYEQGAAQNTFIHADTGLGDYAAVLALGEPGRDNGQLAFWRHRRTGRKAPDPGDEAGMKEIEADGLEEAPWEQTGLVDMPPNRCVIFPASLFHSRYPRDWAEPWPRRIETFFFDLTAAAADEADRLDLDQ